MRGQGSRWLGGRARRQAWREGGDEGRAGEEERQGEAGRQGGEGDRQAEAGGAAGSPGGVPMTFAVATKSPGDSASGSIGSRISVGHACGHIHRVYAHTCNNACMSVQVLLCIDNLTDTRIAMTRTRCLASSQTCMLVHRRHSFHAGVCREHSYASPVLPVTLRSISTRNRFRHACCPLPTHIIQASTLDPYLTAYFRCAHVFMIGSRCLD